MNGYGPAPYNPIQGSFRDPRRTASVLMWIVGGLQAVCMGCCSTLMLALRDPIVEQALNAMSQAPMGQVSTEQAAMMERMMPTMITAVGVVQGLLSLAGFALIALAFAVWAGSKPATIAAMVIIGIEAVAGAGFLLLSSLGSLVSGDFVGLVVTLLLLGGLLALLVPTFVQLLRAVQRPTATRPYYAAPPSAPYAAPPRPPSDEPWNDHLG